jgi:hypothetical protein
MAKKSTISVKPNSRPGRPPSGGRTPIVGLRLRPEIRRRIEKWAAQNGLTFSTGMRKLLEMGLDTAEGKNGEQ